MEPPHASPPKSFPTNPNPVPGDTETTALGLTQRGAAVGMAFMAAGQPGQSIALVSLLGRAGYQRSGAPKSLILIKGVARRGG